MSLVELVVAMGIAATLVGLAIPVTASVIDAERTTQAAQFVAAKFRQARQRAVMSGASTGVVFDEAPDGWTISLCVDGNGNGLRRADLRSGADPCVEPAAGISALFPGVHVAVDATIRGPDGDAPSSDPVHFGASDIASFSPGGGCTAGTIFLRSAKGAQYAIRVAGVTGRTRVLRYQPATGEWNEL